MTGGGGRGETTCCWLYTMLSSMSWFSKFTSGDQFGGKTASGYGYDLADELGTGSFTPTW